MTDFPPRARRLLEATGVGAHGTSTNIVLRQCGTLRTAPGARWLRFTARQEIASDHPAFRWSARVGPLGAIRVTDELTAGVGAGEVSLFGIVPLARQQAGGALLRGELLRYLAELPWAPDAIAANALLNWREIGADSLRVGARIGGIAGYVDLMLGANGLVTSVDAIRPRQVGRLFVDTAWHGRFDEYSTVDGRVIPHSAEVGWTIDGVYQPVWRGRIVEWRRESRRDGDFPRPPGR